MRKDLPSPEMLRKLLRYDAKTGKLFWRERTPDMFVDGKQTAEHTCNRWNSRFTGKEAFTAHDGPGYKYGAVFGQLCGAHRVIWAIIHDEWPSEQIDHINGVRDDNRLENLRSVSGHENSKNQKRPLHNTSGAVGVRWSNASGKWAARIGVDGKQKHLGYFTNFDEAVAARKAAEAEYGFHENHGRD